MELEIDQSKEEYLKTSYIGIGKGKTSWFNGPDDIDMETSLENEFFRKRIYSWFYVDVNGGVRTISETPTNYMNLRFAIKKEECNNNELIRELGLFVGATEVLDSGELVSAVRFSQSVKNEYLFWIIDIFVTLV